MYASNLALFDVCLGRVYILYYSKQESFKLPFLLHEVRGPTYFQYLKIIKLLVHTTYREACLSRDYAQWEAKMSEAILSQSPGNLMLLFEVLLQT